MQTIVRKKLNNIMSSLRLESTNKFSQKRGGMSDKRERQTLIPFLTYSLFFIPAKHLRITYYI